MTATQTITLGEFGPNRIFYTSFGAPAGDTLEIEAGDTFLEDWSGDWWSLEGTVDADGIWRWDGEGDPLDCRSNTVQRIDAWVEEVA